LVLGFSKKPIIGDALPLDVVPVVILCFREQLKPSISKALSYLIQQGVSIRILSGDNPRTVAMVAKDAGVETTEEGFDARELPSDLLEIGNILEKTVLLGRVTPEQKKLIVQSLQKNGHVVAMVGDGVNDALALKQSDLGIAMGSGASSTRQVANLILADSNFDNLPLVIAEGRRVIANIERVSRLFLTKTVWAWSLTVVFGLLYWSFPFLPRQVAAIDAFTIGIPAFLLALLPNSEMYRAGFLRRVLKFAIPSGLITATAVITLVYLADEFFDFRENEIQTAVSILLSISGLWILGTLIRPLNFVRILILALMVLVMITLFQWPMALMFFSLTVLTSIQIWPVFLISFLTIVLIEISNQVTKTQKH
jgi:cation-transporting ATPase E